MGWNAIRLLENFSSLEQQDVSTDAQRVQKTIQEELNRLSVLVGDYAAWDETYDFLRTFDTEYITENFNAASLTNLQVDYILFLDAEGNIVKNIYFRQEDNTLTYTPAEALAEIYPHLKQLIPKDLFSTRAGYLILPESPAAFAARAVVTSRMEGPIRGTMVMGRRLDDKRLRELSDDLMFDIYLAPENAPEIDAMRNDLVHNTAVTLLSGNRISGLVRVDDLDNSESFLVEFNRPRSIFASGKTATILFLAVFAFCALFSSIIGFLLIQRLSRAMKRQRDSERYFSLLGKNSHEIVIFSSYPDLKIIEANEAALKSFAYTREEITGLRVSDLGEIPLDLTAPSTWQKIYKEGIIFRGNHRRSDGEMLPAEVNVEAAISDGKKILSFLVRDISERVEHEHLIEGLYQISNSLRTTLSIAESVPILLDRVQQMFQADGTALVLKRTQRGRFQLFQAIGEWSVISGLDLSLISGILQDYFEKRSVITTGVARFFINNVKLTMPVVLHEVAAVRIISHEQLIGVLVVGRKAAFNHSDELLLESLAELTASTLHRAYLYEQTREYARQIEAVEAVGRTLAETLSLEEIHPRLVEALLGTFDGLESVSIWQRDQQTGDIERVMGMHYDGSPVPEGRTGAIPPEILEVLQTQKPRLIGGPLGEREAGSAEKAGAEGSTLILPALRNEGVMAVLEIHSLDAACFTAEKIDLIELVGSSAAIAYENALLYTEVEKRLSQLQSLREIDAAIVSTFNDGDVLRILLEQIRKQLRADAAVIWMPVNENRHFEVAQTAGLAPGTAPQQLDLETSLAGLALKANQVLPVSTGTQEAVWMTDRAYCCGFAAPMIAQGQPLGVVEVFNHQEISPDVDWYRMFETLARQGAVALSTLGMFKDLQRKNRDLVEAYNATIEGWAKALDMRDHETRGHSLRVAEMTVELARFMGIPENELEHIHRGALLHDIGKMGIPDSILLKAGSLDDKEWETMRLHPVLSAEFLKNIRFLESALDIPLYHHEWWNGAGYPRGLRGEEIPEAARIFAVIDVWDALNSDRPYRLAWPEDAVLPYILTQSGTHFDPQVVEMFVRYIHQRRAKD